MRDSKSREQSPNTPPPVEPSPAKSELPAPTVGSTTEGSSSLPPTSPSTSELSGSDDAEAVAPTVGGVDVSAQQPLTANPMNDSHNEKRAIEGGEQEAPPYPDVDPLKDTDVRQVHEWNDPEALVRAIERHVKTSHGLSSDVDFLRKVANHIRAVVGMKTVEEESASV